MRAQKKKGNVSSAGFLALFLLLTTASTFAAGECASAGYPRSYDCYVNDYNFTNFPDKSKFPPIKPRGREALKYYIENVVPTVARKLPAGRDVQLVAWWTYIENILDRERFPWAYSNCGDGIKEQDAFKSDRDCEEKQIVNEQGQLVPNLSWQVGYGVQVADHFHDLLEVFTTIYGDNKSPKEVGEQVINKSGLDSTLEFPQDFDLKKLKTKEWRDSYSGKVRKRNRFWASLLMRDPLISAYLQAETLYVPQNFPCYGKWREKELKEKSWCDSNGYIDRKSTDSQKMLTIINEWPPGAPRNLRVFP